ncbi:MAG: helix-turn-helix transcriptional regulator [Oscillospiraceae bacterium]|nr:helix-turn-helix transcriptional regulator [Oscillospiraceae bacterium]
MNDFKANTAKNISRLRQMKGMTQLELAEKLNYSDKAVSKWEHGGSQT